MAQCKLTPREFIVNAFSPQVAAVCSANAEATCQKNNLSFIELLQPFCRLSTEGHIKDPQGTIVAIRSLQISIKDVNHSPPEPNIARKLLNESVNSNFSERTTVVQTGSIDLDVPVSVTWFEAWRDTFLNVQFPSDHEFTKHFLACMIVVSTTDDNPLEKIQQIGAQLNQSVPGKLPKWFNNNALRYYILIHDAIQDDKKKAEDIFTEMKNIYNPNNCFFLQMNSRPFSVSDDNTHLPDPWSQFIVKHSDLSGNSDQDSSPRTPVDTIGVSSMPSAVNTEPDKSTSQAGTPIVPRNFAPTPDRSENISISSEISDSQIIQLEVGQEAVPSSTIATIHPLSPESELPQKFNNAINLHSHLDVNSPINVNVWADSPTNVAPQHGARLSTEDLERLKLMMSEFCLKSLLPYVERQIGLLNELISNKKGVSRSLFSATKRWFGTSKPGVPGSVPANAVIYTSESPELQLRRLGDLCFMFGHYTLAYQAYHNAKRDFAADQAWIYYAGALEMAALSAFMMDEMIRKTIEYMDDAITTYLNTCKMPQFATRATLLSAECLKNRGLYGEAAKQLIRMTSEDSDLRSALLLEQAAYCFISPKMVRKYAFHAVLAGHRFSKAGQKKHSLRCYKQAYQVYQNKGWSLAEDHIHFTIGRQAASLKQVTEAVVVFEKLLNASSKQPALQQAAFLREFLYIHNLNQESKSLQTTLPILPLPLVEDNQIKVLLGPLIRPGNNIELVSQILSFSQDADDVRWSKLEEILLSKAQGTPPMIFKPTVTIYTNTSNNSSKPNAVVNEPIYLCITLSNPLLIPLPLANLKLLWTFNNDEHSVDNESTIEYEECLVETLKIDSVTLQPASKQTVVLSLKPKKIGQLKIFGLSYDLSNPVQATIDQVNSNPTFVSGKRMFEIRGPKLKNFKEKPGISLYGTDLRLEMNIVDKGPFMQITFTALSPEMLCGELQCMEVTLKNIGSAPLKNIHLGSTNPRLFTLINQEHDFKKGQTKKADELVTKLSLPSEKNDILVVGDSFQMTLWVCAPHKKGNNRLDLLFYYENVEAKSIPKHRLSRHSWHLTVLDSIQSSAIARRSAMSKDNFSLLNLIVHIKNSNQVYDPFMNEIELTNIAFQSDSWILMKPKDNYTDVKVQPQEMIHFLLKLARKADDKGNFSDIPLSKNVLEQTENLPFINFIKKRHIVPLDANDTQNDNQQSRMQIENDPIASTMKLDSTVILRWKAKVTEGGAVIRNAIGQHYIDLHYLNKPYNHPVEKQVEPIEYSGRLRIFGPDINIPDAQILAKKDQYSELECQKNLVWFSLSHSKEVAHNFSHSRICVVPVTMNMQNNSKSSIHVKVDTVGTSSQTLLPNLKSQLYSPQASTSFRYAGKTSITCRLEPHGQHEVKLQAILPTSGAYDLSSRIEVSARIENKLDYTLQKWHMESVCIISNTETFTD